MTGRPQSRLGCARTAVLCVVTPIAWQEPLEDGGRRIISITDRPMVVWKEAMQQQVMNDAFTVIELRLPADSEGEGKVAIGSNIHVNRSLDLIELKDYDIEPVRQTDVRVKCVRT